MDQAIIYTVIVVAMVIGGFMVFDKTGKQEELKGQKKARKKSKTSKKSI